MGIFVLRNPASRSVVHAGRAAADDRGGIRLNVLDFVSVRTDAKVEVVATGVCVSAGAVAIHSVSRCYVSPGDYAVNALGKRIDNASLPVI